MISELMLCVLAMCFLSLSLCRRLFANKDSDSVSCVPWTLIGSYIPIFFINCNTYVSKEADLSAIADFELVMSRPAISYRKARILVLSKVRSYLKLINLQISSNHQDLNKTKLESSK